MTSTMKAVRIHSFGGPDVLRYEDVSVPEPKSNELLIRVHAAGVNPVDWKIREGHLGQIPLPSVLGSDFAGAVEATGSDVKGFRTGDSVFGIVSDDSGGYAEYAVAPDSQVARIPKGLDFLHAAALPVASITPWQALFDIAQLQKGQKVLIHAAAGGVGSFAVQFAKWKGAYVIGTASAQTTDYVKSLGADEVIDYRKTKFEDVVRDVDVVLDTQGGDTQERSWRVIKPGGILVSIVSPPPKEKPTAPGVRGVFLSSKPRGDEFAQIADLVARGIVKVNIETVFPLKDARKAQELSQSGHAHGKIVLTTEAESH
ncbi:Alcohol dehydrogenase zinc-binding domain protein [Pedosphaera parvula Ellin514]|uniref:Alcohol dehydrogenase zinc-binding domain protein n=2 Tax=Pedosphaera TaxID=1032526 RepID=B9XBP9_PEDPL|nr:Alcohol dehydrogenase zinc-binding domain protein [Pedosphaera parvula Ellin514]